jgi:phosphoglycolate phosphatase
MDHLVARALPEEARTPEIIAAGVEQYRAHYEELWRNKTRLYDGIGEMLDALEAQGLKLAVISNKAHRFVVPMCHHFFGIQRFLGILGQRPEVERKPDAAGGLEMAAQLGVDPAECAYIGDSGVDMAFAKNCGMLGVGVRWGFRTEAELLAHGACHLISHPAELLPLLEK